MSDDTIIDKLRAQALRRRNAADEQSPRYDDFAEHCRKEAELFDAAADCIERLLGEVREARMN